MLQTASPSARPGTRIAVVDDDAAIRALVARVLRQDGYDVFLAADGAELDGLIEAHPIDLVLLDVMLPGRSGLDICAALRRCSRVPVIMVSARGCEADRVAGLDGGADDYLAKPFGRAELLARVRAVLRRVDDPRVGAGDLAPERFAFAGWSYAVCRRLLLSPEGVQVDLTDAEHDLLLALLRHAGLPIGRERLLELCRGRVAGAPDRSIDVAVGRLRRKLGDDARREPFIHTVRGVGYMFDAAAVAA